MFVVSDASHTLCMVDNHNHTLNRVLKNCQKPNQLGVGWIQGGGRLAFLEQQAGRVRRHIKPLTQTFFRFVTHLFLPHERGEQEMNA